MQVGQTIQGQKHTYYLRARLGLPGLYGLAFLATIVNEGDPASEQEEVVIKFLRSDAPSDAQELLQKEAETLLAVEEAEKRAGQHYAVRLKDQLFVDKGDSFLVLERACGQNVTEHLLDPQAIEAQDPAYELLALRIMHSFANALRYVHQAGRLYLDMKLDNLFWDKEQASLRIIDWNVVGKVSEGVASDWARFGARLYEFLTGKYIEITPDGKTSDRPSGAAWENLSYGVKNLINDALALRYNDDDNIYALLGRELEQAQIAAKGDWRSLLQLANQANSFRAAPNEVLATLWRANKILQKPPISVEKENALKELQSLEQQAQERQGFANDNALRTAFQFLANGNISLARSQFERTYNASGKRDPRARRGIWLCLIAEEKQQVYPSVKEDLSKALEFLALPQPNLEACYGRLDMVNDRLADSQTYSYLKYELVLLQTLQSSDLARITASVEKQSSLSALLNLYPDLKSVFVQLEERAKQLQVQEQEAQQRKQLEGELEQAQQEIQGINLETSYAEQLKRYANLHSLLEKNNQPHEEHRRKEVAVLLKGLELLKEFEELENEAKHVADTEGNWKAFERRLIGSKLKLLASPLVSYGRWQERQTQWREQQGYWEGQEKRWDALDLRTSNQNEALETLQADLNGVRDTLEQHHTSLEFLKNRLDSQETLLHAVDSRLSNQGELIDKINSGTNILTNQQERIEANLTNGIGLVHKAQDEVVERLDGLLERTQTISAGQAELKNQPQTDIASFITNQWEVDSINKLIEKRLLNKASEEVRKLPVAAIRSDFEHQITLQQLHAEEVFANYKAALDEIDRDIEKPINLYQNLLQLWLDNSSFYEEGSKLLSTLSGFLDKQDLSAHSALQMFGFAEYTQSIQALWRELQQAKRTLIGSEDKLVQSLDRLCDDVSNLFKATIFLSGLKEVSNQAKHLRLLKARDELAKLRFKPSALVAKIDRATGNISKTS